MGHFFVLLLPIFLFWTVTYHVVRNIFMRIFIVDLLWHYAILLGVYSNKARNENFLSCSNKHEDPERTGFTRSCFLFSAFLALLSL